MRRDDRRLKARLPLGFGLVVVLALGPAAAVLAQQPSAPAVGGTASAAEAERLRERAAAFWAARTEGNATAQWELLEPRGRGRMTAAEYAAAGPVRYLAYQVEDARINGFFAAVAVRILTQVIVPTSAPRIAPPSAAVVLDRWVRIRGSWHRSLEQEDSGEPLPGQQ
jgi:RecB family exonuclease